MAFTFLRDNLYADFIPAMVGADGVIRGPAGHGRVAAVAQDDIADAAAAVLLAPTDHAGATHSLTGPESVPEAYASRASYGAPDWQVDAWVSTYTSIAAGELAGVTDDMVRLAGHPATSLAELLSRGGSAY